MLTLGIDLGTSSVKVSVIDTQSQRKLASSSWPDAEAAILSPQQGWAEQSPETWWEHVQIAIRKCHESAGYDPKDIGAIGIAYQMHGLVLINSAKHSIRNAIIWCDSRAVETGADGLEYLTEDYCQHNLLNDPGNFTASKLAWVRQYEPFVYNRIHHFMLPGDFISMKLTGEITTTSSALSEGVFWDFQQRDVSDRVLNWVGWDRERLQSIRPVFGSHGELTESIAAALSLRPGIPVTYKAGDQPNNALGLQVMHPGEVAVNAGTSGVVYAVTDSLIADPESRVNSFAHVNYRDEEDRIGVLLCINGAAIFNRWAKQLAGGSFTYNQINRLASSAPKGSAGLLALPFGNGAERMLNNHCPGAAFSGLDLNLHSTGHWLRAVQEGIAFAFRYGMDLMRENGMQIDRVRAGRANLFQSELFAQTFATMNRVPLELYETDGSIGAAIGAAIGAGIYSDASDASRLCPVLRVVEPDEQGVLAESYEGWQKLLTQSLTNIQSDQTVPLNA